MSFPVEPPLPTRGGRAAFSSLRNQQFRWLYASNIAFFFAMNGQMIVRSYIAFKLTGSAFSLGLINLAVAVPMLIISPIGGVIADRVERRQLIIGGQIILVLNELVVLVLIITGTLAFWHLMAVAFLMGGVFPFIMPARSAIVANIVGRQGMSNAMALSMGGMNAARVVAPALAGFLIYLVGVRSTYAVAVAMYLVALFAMLRVHTSQPQPRLVKTTMYADIIQGMKYVRDEPTVRVIMLIGMLPILLAMPFQALLVVFAEDVWNVGSRGLGVLQAAAGLGGLAGAFYIAWSGDTKRKLRLMMLSLMCFGFGLLAFALSPMFLIGLLFVFVADIFASIFQTTNNTVIQVLIPDEVRGRVMSLMMMTFGLTPLGTVPISLLADAFGAPIAVAAASVAMMLIGVAFYLLSASFRNLDSTVRAAMEQEVAPRLAGARAGPGRSAPMPVAEAAPAEPTGTTGAGGV
jgi:MFS family permease